MVETSHGRAVITGTTFNIKADNDKMDLAVIKGSVRFESEKGTVTVQGGYQSSIALREKPTKPVICNVTDVSEWAKGQESNKTIQVNPPDVYFTKMLDLPVNFIPYRDLEKIDFNVWIEEHRPWFEREFPWTKRLQNILSQNGIQVNTIDLLIESGDLWRFAWPEHSSQRILTEDWQAVQKVSNQYGIEIEKLLPVRTLAQVRQVSNIEALQKWSNEFEEKRSSSIIDSIHAAIFLTNTQSLAWFAVQNDKIQVQDKHQILDLLTEQVKTTSDSLEILNQLILADTNKSACSTAQYDEYVRNLKGNISSIMEIEKELADYEISSK